MLFTPKHLGFRLQLWRQLGNAVGRFFTRVLFKTVPKISRHLSKLGTFDQMLKTRTLREKKIQLGSEVGGKKQSKNGAQVLSITRHTFLTEGQRDRARVLRQELQEQI